MRTYPRIPPQYLFFLSMRNTRVCAILQYCSIAVSAILAFFKYPKVSRYPCASRRCGNAEMQPKIPTVVPLALDRTTVEYQSLYRTEHTTRTEGRDKYSREDSENLVVNTKRWPRSVTPLLHTGEPARETTRSPIIERAYTRTGREVCLYFSVRGSGMRNPHKLSQLTRESHSPCAHANPHASKPSKTLESQKLSHHPPHLPPMHMYKARCGHPTWNLGVSEG